MFNKINELLNKVRTDLDTSKIKTSSSEDGLTNLETIFPKVDKIFYLDTDRNTDFSYTRVNLEEFEVVDTLWDEDSEEFEPIISDIDMLQTVKQSIKDGSYTLGVQKTMDKRYDLILREV